MCSLESTDTWRLRLDFCYERSFQDIFSGVTSLKSSPENMMCLVTPVVKDFSI